MRLWRDSSWLLTIPLLLLTAWLGARGLNAYAIWFDEYFSIFESGGAFYGPLAPFDLIVRAATYSPWPPAFDIVLACWSALVGSSAFAGRSLSWLFGLLSVAVMHRLARLLLPHDRLFALAAVTLMGGSAFYIYYLHELRGYTLHILLGCSATALYWQLMTQSSRRAVRLAFTASLTLLLYSHPVGQLWFAILAIFHILSERRNQQWNSIFFLFFVAGVSYSPWIFVMIQRVSIEIAAPRAADTGTILFATITAYSNWLTLIIIGLCALTLPHLREKPIRFLWWWVVGLLALVLVIDRLVSFLFHVRFLIALLPAVVLLAAAGLSKMRRFRPLQIAVSAAWLVMGVYLVSQPTFMSDLPGSLTMVSLPGFEAALDVLRQQASAQDAIVFHLTDIDEEHWMNPSLQYYLHGSPLHFTLLSLVNEHMDASFEARLRSFVTDSSYVWVATVPDIAPGAETALLDTVLAERYARCPAMIDLPDMKLDLYTLGNLSTCTAPRVG